MKKFIVILTVTILSGCASLGMKRPVSDDDMGKFKNVGVVSLMGTTFNGIHIGLTAFNNKYYRAEIDNWKIDNFASKRLLAELKTTNRYMVSTIDINPSRVDDFYKGKNSVTLNYEKLLTLAIEKNYDAIVLIKRAKYDNAPFHIGGYGFYERSGLYSGRCIYSLFIIEVVDVKTQKQLAWEWGYPCLHGDEDISWKGSFDEYSVQEKQLIKARLESHIQQSINQSLEKLRLVPNT